MSARFALPPPPDPQAAIDELRTVRDLIRWACTRMAATSVALGQGTDTLRDEACWLVLWALRLPLDEPEPHLEARLLREERATVVSLIERRCREGLPSAYLTGEAWLRGLRFLADPRALVPRSLLVEAIESGFAPWLQEPQPKRILDLCTGGGSIAIAAALHFEQALVDASDVCEQALSLAAENIALYRLGDRVGLHQGDLFAALAGRRYDLILSNPPYVNAASMGALPREFRHEPETALAGGPDGMQIIRRMIDAASGHLEPDGLLVIEIGHEAEHFEAAFPDLEFAYLPVSAGERMIVAVQAGALPARARPTGAPRRRGR